LAGLLAAAPDEVEQATESPVRVPLTGDELSLEHQILRICRSTVGRPTVGEQTHAIPRDWLDAALRDKAREMLDVVAASIDPETIHLPVAVEGSECGRPVAFVSVTQRHHLHVLGHDRDRASGRSELAERVDERFGFVEVHKNSVAQHAAEDLASEFVGGVLAGGLDESHSTRDVGTFTGDALPGPLEHAGRRVHDGDLVAEPCERKALVACSATDINQM